MILCGNIYEIGIVMKMFRLHKIVILIVHAVWFSMFSAQDPGEPGFCSSLEDLTFSYYEIEPLIIGGTIELDRSTTCAFMPSHNSRIETNQDENQRNSNVTSNGNSSDIMQQTGNSDPNGTAGQSGSNRNNQPNGASGSGGNSGLNPPGGPISGPGASSGPSPNNRPGGHSRPARSSGPSGNSALNGPSGPGGNIGPNVNTGSARQSEPNTGPSGPFGSDRQTGPGSGPPVGQPVSGTLYKVLKNAVTSCCGSSENLTEYRR